MLKEGLDVKTNEGSFPQSADGEFHINDLIPSFDH